ncbi:transcription factor-like 5 protein [Polymixia lowei]
MSTFSTACKTVHISPSSRECNSDSIGVIVSQSGSGTHDQGQVFGTDLSLMEMTEVEYTCLQHIIQTHMEAQGADPDGSDARFHPTILGLGGLAIQPVTTKSDAGSTVISPSPTIQAIDLSTSHNEQSAISDASQQETVDIQKMKMILTWNTGGILGQKTPATCGEDPVSVLARVKSEVSVTQAEQPANSSASFLTRPHPSARVCLEKRFSCMPDDIPRQQDAQSTVLSNFLAMLKQSTEAREASMHPQMQNWLRSDQSNPIELSKPYGGSMFNPIAGMCGQVCGHIPHIVEPNKHQGLIVPKNFSFSYCPERVATKAQSISRTNTTGEQQWLKVENDAVAKPAAPKRARAQGPQNLKAANTASYSERPKVSGKAVSSTGMRTGPPVERSQRRERHNSKERDRRKRIRLSCDELNMLVPFCKQETDRATTLQWTTAFLKYIREVYGDSFKEDFQNMFCRKTDLRLKSSTASGQIPIHQEMADRPSTPLATEQ